jgi:hypothetical protein
MDMTIPVQVVRCPKEQIKVYEEDGCTADKTAEQTQGYQVISIEGNKPTYIA